MDAGTKIAAIASGIIVVAIVAVLVSQNAQTSSVLSSATGGFAQILQVAVSPVTGAGNLSGMFNNFSTALGEGGLI